MAFWLITEFISNINLKGASGKNPACDFDQILAVQVLDALAASKVTTVRHSNNWTIEHQNSVKNSRHFSIKIAVINAILISVTLFLIAFCHSVVDKGVPVR